MEEKYHLLKNISNNVKIFNKINKKLSTNL